MKNQSIESSISYDQKQVLVFQPRPQQNTIVEIVYTPVESDELQIPSVKTSRGNFFSTAPSQSKDNHYETLNLLENLLDYLRKNFNKRSMFHRRLVRLKSICANAYISVRNHVILARNDEEDAFTSPYCK